MKRLILTLLLMLAAWPCWAADAILVATDPGQTLYVRIRTAATTSVAEQMTEGTGNGAGFYVVTDAALVTAGLSGTANYPYKVFIGTESTSAADPEIASGVLRWGSTVAVDPLPIATAGSASGIAIVGSAMNLADDAITAAKVAADAIGASELATDAIGALELAADAIGASELATDAIAAAELAATAASEIASGISSTIFAQVDADVVGDAYTWIGKRYRATNIVEVGDNFDGTLALKPDVNPGTTISTVDSVSITGAAVVTATDLTVNRDRTKSHFTVPTLTTTGTYTVIVTVTTVDGQTIPTTCTLKVY